MPSYFDYCNDQQEQSYFSNSRYGSANEGLSRFSDYRIDQPREIDIDSMQLPAPNNSCYQEPPVPIGETKFCRHEEPTIIKTITQNYSTCKAYVKENNIHHEHVRKVVYNVNRNHWHTQRIINKDNNHHHFLTNNVIKINDIHHQKIEQVRGEGKTYRDYKQTQCIEGPFCSRRNSLYDNTSADECDQY